jgi:hypothetical protein
MASKIVRAFNGLGLSERLASLCRGRPQIERGPVRITVLSCEKFIIAVSVCLLSWLINSGMNGFATFNRKGGWRQEVVIGTKLLRIRRK